MCLAQTLTIRIINLADKGHECRGHPRLKVRRQNQSMMSASGEFADLA
jgi:hypothetical protein